MWIRRWLPSLAAALACLALGSLNAAAQTPEQERAWESQRAQSIVEEKAREERLNRERAARRADPMAWVRTRNPLSAGGWEFRAVAGDGAWATYSTPHQAKRSGRMVTVWLRQEFAEPQAAGNGPYSSLVEKVQYDCSKDRARSLVTIYYSDNDLQGTTQTEESDEKTAGWTSIVPGTREEIDFLWACGAGNSARGP